MIFDDFILLANVDLIRLKLNGKSFISLVGLVSPVVSADRITALEEVCHRLVGTTDLHLHEIGSVMAASGAIGVSGVNVLPGFRAAHNHINFLK